MTPKLKIPEINPVVRMAEIKNDEISEILNYNKRKKAVFKEWIQTNNSIYAQEADDWLVAQSPSAYRIFKFLLSNMDDYNSVICSYKVMQEKFDFSKATIERAIKFLKDHKYINIAKSGTSNVYFINKTLYWNSWGNNYKYAEFGAKVIISSTEQEDESKEKVKTQIKRRNEVVIKKNEHKQNFLSNVEYFTNDFVKGLN